MQDRVIAVLKDKVQLALASKHLKEVHEIRVFEVLQQNIKVTK